MHPIALARELGLQVVVGPTGRTFHLSCLPEGYEASCKPAAAARKERSCSLQLRPMGAGQSTVASHSLEMGNGPVAVPQKQTSHPGAPNLPAQVPCSPPPAAQRAPSQLASSWHSSHTSLTEPAALPNVGGEGGADVDVVEVHRLNSDPVKVPFFGPAARPSRDAGDKVLPHTFKPVTLHPEPI